MLTVITANSGDLIF
uniref:Uncharacterized protein n=1 Tax=Oryza glumipatula TaxID=40148 RepID=A0A0D9ZY51_9ORYZ